MATIIDDEQALAFAIMLQAGLPATEAILYFVESEDPMEIALELKKWQSSSAVKKATLKLMRKPFHEMSLDERIKAGIDMHYSNLAYLLFSRNYIEANAGEKSKMDAARVALEAKMAGLAGKSDALSRFFEDINSGKLILNPVVKKAN